MEFIASIGELKLQIRQTKIDNESLAFAQELECKVYQESIEKDYLALITRVQHEAATNDSGKATTATWKNMSLHSHALRESILCAHVLRMRGVKRAQDKMLDLRAKYTKKTPAQDFNSDGTVADKAKMVNYETELEMSRTEEQKATDDIDQFDAMKMGVIESEPEIGVVKVEEGAAVGPG